MYMCSRSQHGAKAELRNSYNKNAYDLCTNEEIARMLSRCEDDVDAAMSSKKSNSDSEEVPASKPKAPKPKSSTKVKKKNAGKKGNKKRNVKKPSKTPKAKA